MRVRLNSSGQALVIAVFLGLLMVLSFPIVIYLNQINSSHQALVEKKVKGLVTAKEAVAYAEEILSTHWQAALDNQFSTTTGLEDCSGTTLLTGLDGSQFKITCDKTSGQSYQVHVTGTAMASFNGTLRPIRKLEAYVSRETVAMNLPNDQHSAIALQLGSAPAVNAIYNGNVVVQWGPFDCLDPTTSMNITNSIMDSDLFPRVFLNSGLISASHPTITPSDPTDSKEVWAYQKLGSPPPLDDLAYRNAADGTPMGVFPLNCVAMPCLSPAPSNGLGTGHFTVGSGNVLELDSTFLTHLATLTPGAVIYIDGDAELDAFEWDAKPVLGALIVTNNLYLNNLPSTPLAGALRIPPTANLEYFSSTYLMPTNTSPPYQFRGFLWVKNNLIVQQNNWGLAGTVVVGDPSSPGVTGQLDIATSASLTIYYDDEINRDIKVTAVPVQLQSDSLREVTP